MSLFIGTSIIGARPATVEFIASGSNTTNPINSFTISSASLGPSDPSRQIIVACQRIDSSSGLNNSCSVAGVAAASVFDFNPAATSQSQFWITPREDAGGPSGTTGNIVVGFNANILFTTVVAFAAYNLRNGTAVFDADGVSFTNPAQVSINLAGGGILVAAARESGTPAAFTWVGATEVVDTLGSGVTSTTRRTGALTSETPAATGHTVGVTALATMIAASFR